MKESWPGKGRGPGRGIPDLREQSLSTGERSRTADREGSARDVTKG